MVHSTPDEVRAKPNMPESDRCPDCGNPQAPVREVPCLDWRGHPVGSKWEMRCACGGRFDVIPVRSK